MPFPGGRLYWGRAAENRAEGKQELMGLTKVTVAVSNLAKSKRAYEGLFLVDTGATDCLAPRSKLLKL